MKPLITLVLSSFIGLAATAQTTIMNGGFELWGNTAPGVAAEPTHWYSNKSGSNVAALGPQTCFQDNSIVHSGSSSVRVENATVPIIGTVVNGNVTTSIVNAPTTTKSDGYIGSRNYSDTTDVRHMAFTGRPDSLVGWYQYTPGDTSEQGKIRVILHTGDYYDPELPSTFHPDASANKIADALFLTPKTTVSTWARFSIPFTYVSGATPAYIMINMTSSANQNTTFSGSKMWIDDLDVIYNTTGVNNIAMQETDIHAYAAEHTLFVNAAKEISNGTTLILYDMTGKEVSVNQLDGRKFAAINLSYLPSGIYIYKINNTSFSKTGKISL